MNEEIRYDQTRKLSSDTNDNTMHLINIAMTPVILSLSLLSFLNKGMTFSIGITIFLLAVIGILTVDHDLDLSMFWYIIHQNDQHAKGILGNKLRLQDNQFIFEWHSEKDRDLLVATTFLTVISVMKSTTLIDGLLLFSLIIYQIMLIINLVHCEHTVSTGLSSLIKKAN